MTLSISLSRKAQAKLKKQAAAEGKDLMAYASDLLEKAVTRPSLRELFAPSQAQFAKSGKSRQQVMDMGRRIVQRVRGAKGE
jgi:hypothetical protein